LRDRPAKRDRIFYYSQTSRKRHVTGFEGQASIKRQAFIELDQQKEAGF
jgi:hypothetical protein